MHPFFQRPGVRRVRIVFRWCRISLWLVLFLAVAAVSYLHLTGLPDFVKRPMLRQLLAHGVEAQFSNMQLGWERGPSIVIENAAFSRVDQPLSPRLSASRAKLELDRNALLHGRFELRSLQVSDAQLQLPVSEAVDDVLLLNNVALSMRFFSNDVVKLDRCQGSFRGIQTDLIGVVSHAGALRRWQIPAGGGSTNVTFQTRLRDVARILKKIDFSGKPDLQIEAGVDGRDMNSFHAELNFDAPAAHTPWGDVTNLVIDAACARLFESGHQSFLQVKCSASSLAALWARSGKFSFLTTVSHGANSNLEAELNFDAARFEAPLDSAGSNWFGAARFSGGGSVTLASSNLIPVLGAGKLRAVKPQTPWGSARELSLECRATPATNAQPPEAGWGPWAAIVPWTLDWQAEMSNMASPKLRLDHLAFSGHWHAPQIVIENFRGELYGGRVNAGGILDINSRELHCKGTTDFNPHSVSQLFNPAASNWLAQLDWSTPPKVNAQMRLVLPPWTNRPAGWSADMFSSLQLAGDFTVGHSSFNRVEDDSAAAQVTYTNQVWNVTHLHALRPEGDIDLDYTTGPQEYHYLIDSRLDPKSVLSLVAPGHPHVLDDFAFKQSPVIHTEIWGRWRDPGISAFTATALAANFAAFGEPVAAFSADVDYTNRILTVRSLSLSNSQCRVQAPWLQADLGTKMVRVTNVAGIVDPAILQRVLRRNSPDFLSVIHFDSLPSFSASGAFSLTNSQAVDLRFLVSGRRLHYTNLLADRITGEVDWAGQTVSMTNIAANLYDNGSLMGWLVFATTPQTGTDFHADFTVKDIDLPSMVTGMTGKTNKLEGRLDGDLDLAGPNNSADPSKLQGRGRIHVHDALLWDIKVFGMLSPVLNLFSPGWGYSRARDAVADFVITNGAISSDNVEMRCSGFVLKLHGTIDTNKQINARLEAVLSRDTPLIGELLSLAFTPLSKMLEYRVSGPWSDPVPEPVYVPRFITHLLHPFKALKAPATSESPPTPNEAK
jgi:hypothetical protein